MATPKRKEDALLAKIRSLPPAKVVEVENFVEFLAAQTRKRAALERLLAIAPALEAAGVEPMSEEEIAAEVEAVRKERRAKSTARPSRSKESGEDRS